MRPFLKVLVPFYLIFIIHNYVFAEGTKQVQPIAANDCVLDLLNGTSTYKNWGTYLGTGVDERIHIHIKNFANERIYWGLNQITAGNLYYRIKDPSGTIVVGPSLVPTVGLPGYINTYAEAVAGPSALAGGGYNALSYNPLMNGDYYIEFNFGSPTAASGTPMQFNYFDFTVSDLSTSQPILGRLWSEAWGLNTNAAATPANSVFYVYTADSVVTTLDMNGMNPFGFSVVCNKTGVTNSGVVATDRKSVINKVLYASYKIFLNNPDPSEYPSGISATLSSTPQVTGCPSGGTGYCIEIFPSKPCQSDVFLDFNGNGVYDAGTRDVLFSQNLSAGYNCVPWNGKDGLGTLVTAGLSITINIKVISGLTNFPIFDAEFDNNGVKVAIVRPALPPPLVFWDDSGLLPPTNPGGIANSSDVTTNLTGSASPAHKWDNNANVNNSVANGNGFGNNRTINTWWYTYSLNTNLSYTVTNACPPVGTNDVVATCLNSPVTFNPLANDTDPENNINPSSVTVSTAPKHGGTVINAGGTITYTPTAGYTDYDTLAYSVCDFSTPTPLCTTATVFITVNPTFTLSKTDYCGAAAIGTISFATTVNTLKYDYTAGATYTGPVPPTANTSVVGTNTISALAGGTYTVRLHNPALGCFTDKTITIVANANPTLTLSKSDVCGAGNTTGIITFPTGVTTLKYDYSAAASYTGPVPPSAFASVNGTNTIGGLAAGTYTVRLYNPATGCFTDQSITINTIATVPPTLTLSKTDVCGATTGKISFPTTVTTLRYNYTSGLTYTGVTPATATINGTNNITPLAAGTYTVRLRDPASGCFTDGTISVVDNNPVLSIATTNICGAGTGTLSFATPVATYKYDKTAGATYTGPVPPAAFTSVNGTNTIAGLAAGTYTVRLYNPGNTCFVDKSATIIGGTNPTLTLTKADICTSAVGGITFPTTVTTLDYGYTAGATYTGPNPPASSTVNGTNSIINLSAGTYTVRLTDPVSGCFTDASSTIADNRPAYSGNITKTDACGAALGSISFPTASAAFKYNYTSGATYTGGVPATATIVGTNVIANTGAGIFTIRLYNPGNTCYKDSTKSVNNNNPTLGLSATDVCGAATNGTISFGTTVNTYKYDKSIGATYTGAVPPAANTSVVGTNTISALAANTYTVRLHDPATGCFKDQTITVNSNPNPTLTLSKTDACAAAANGTITFPTTVTTLRYNYTAGASYTGGIPATATVNGTNTISTLTSGTYTVRLYNPATACFTDQTIVVNSITTPTLTLSSGAGTNVQSACVNVTALTSITYTVGGGATGASVSGLPAGLTTNFAAGTFTISGTPTASGTFNYTVSTTGMAPCAAATATGTITVIATPTIALSSGAGTNVQSACVNVTALTSITYTVGGGATGASVSGLPAGLTTNFAAGTFTISGTPTASGTFNYTVSTTGMAPCAAATATGTITVIATPTIALSTGAGTNVQSACVNVTSLTRITYTV
ncbi:MAG: beta strand repeat-containing protein, partial [Cytophagaceae bacterium]